jgi:hypothetical protein
VESLWQSELAHLKRKTTFCRSYSAAAMTGVYSKVHRHGLISKHSASDTHASLKKSRLILSKSKMI